MTGRAERIYEHQQRIAIAVNPDFANDLIITGCFPFVP
jgi:hypothetical protein